MAVLEIRDLHKRYEPSAPPALAGVSLTVQPGEFVGVLGLSGAGKSTMLRCVNGLVRPSGGEVLYRGQHVEKATGAELRAIRREIAMVFQGLNLIERLTVTQNVLAGALGRTGFWQAVLGRFEGADRTLAADALQRVGLGPYAHKRVTELSGGQRQRVAIARALVQRPRLLLADEPVSSLDPVTARATLALLRSVSAEDGITTVVNLHSVALVREFATRAVGIAAGSVVFDGSPADLSEDLLRRIYPVEPAVSDSSRLVFQAFPVL